MTSSAESVDDHLTEFFSVQSAPSSPSRRTVSQRPDVAHTLLSVRDIVSSIENLSSVSSVNSTIMSLKEELKPFKGSRTSYKGKITIVLNGLKAYSDAGTLDQFIVKKQVTQVTNYLAKIEEIDQSMSDVWDKYSVSLE